MKFTVTRACGHIEVVQLFDKNDERQRKLAWYESTVCEKCYAKQKSEQNNVEQMSTKERINLAADELGIDAGFIEVVMGQGGSEYGFNQISDNREAFSSMEPIFALGNSRLESLQMIAETMKKFNL